MIFLLKEIWFFVVFYCITSFGREEYGNDWEESDEEDEEDADGENVV